MKKIIIILTLIVSTAINAQSTERFIRIIGNSKKEIRADKVKIYFSVSELKANNFDKNSKDVDYDTAYKKVALEFSKIGIDKNSIENVIKNRNNYNKKSKKFYVETSILNLQKIRNIEIYGFGITDTKYIYEEIDKNIETELSLKAIKDAKRKAKAICDDINMSVGKILNIEIREGDFWPKTKERKENNQIVTYKVSIIFKLID